MENKNITKEITNWSLINITSHADKLIDYIKIPSISSELEVEVDEELVWLLLSSLKTTSCDSFWNTPKKYMIFPKQRRVWDNIIKTSKSNYSKFIVAFQETIKARNFLFCTIVL